MPTVHEVLCSHLYNIELVMGEDILALRMSIQCPMLSKTQWQLDYFFFRTLKVQMNGKVP
jgi:hypothetical protein